MAWVHAYYVLSVGQGTGTLVQACEDTLDDPRWSVIIDLGSTGWLDDEELPTAEFVAEKLKQGKEEEEPVTLDAVILSHSDSDHINLIPDLLAEFSKPRDKKRKRGKPKLTVNEVWYGGDREKYRKGNGANVLDELYEYRPIQRPDDGTNLNDLPVDASSLNETAPNPLVDSNEMEAWIWLLVGNTIADQVRIGANTPTRTPREGYATNTVSLVVGAAFGKGAHVKEIFATGDATGLTIAKCREMIQESQKRLAPSLSVTLPHHGSATTTYDLLGLKGDVPTKTLAEQNIEGFVAELRPVTVTASSGENATYKHPAIGVAEDFGAYVEKGAYVDPDPLLKQGKEHFYTARMPSGHFRYLAPVESIPSDWPSKAYWFSARTTANIFTTDYFFDQNEEVPTAWNREAIYRTPEESDFDPVPPRTISWLFIVENGGAAWRIEKPVDTLGLDARQRRWVEEAIGGPLPPDRFVHIPSADARD